ncbi:MAG TPA: MCE family protein, partial [Pseudomonadota bacterium]|nr:MCE family protein [Pseudomonadota bacterium]
RMEAATGKAEQLMGGEAREALASARESLDSARRFTDSAYTLVEQNRDAFANFSNQGLAQAGPVLAELRATLRKLQAIADRLEADPTGYVLGKDQPKEYPAQ